MRHSRIAFLWLLVTALFTATCTKSSSPTQASGITAPDQPTVSSSTPRPASPLASETIPFASQPVKLVVSNAVSTAPDAPTYTFQVATDQGFTKLVTTKSAVVAGSGGQTSVTLDSLAGATTYYWRALIVANGEPGPISAGSAFTVGPQVVIQATDLLSPEQNGTTTEQPTLTVNNVQRSGPAGEIVYRFDVASDADFGSIVYSAQVKERTGSATTEHVVATKLAEKTYFWRVLASSPSTGVAGPYSATRSFKAANGLDLRTAIIVIGPANIVDWQETAKITDAYFDPVQESLCIYHTRLGLWPPALFAADGTTTEGNQWVFANINGKWYGGAADYYRPNQACKGLNAESIGRDAFYMNQSSPMYSWQPKSGELYAVMVSTPARAWPTYKTYDERSNIVYLRWP